MYYTSILILQICIYLLDLSATFDTQSSDPPVHPLIVITRIPLRWFDSLVGIFRQPGEGRYPEHINWSLGFLRARFLDPSLLHIHYITGSHHTSTWFLIPFLCWWHTALSLISIRWSNGICTDLRLPGRHLGMDERTSPTAQPGKDWAPCLPCNSNSTARLHHSVRFINNYPISFGQKSLCNLWWPADLQRTHCKNCSNLQICTTQHQKSGPFWQSMLHNFLSRPLSSLDWTSAMLF